MEGWQMEVRMSRNIRADQDDSAGMRLIIRGTSEDLSMPTEDVLNLIRSSNMKPIIIDCRDPFKGKNSERKAVIGVLMSKGEVFRWATAL